jgi:MoxR-like ATPase
MAEEQVSIDRTSHRLPEPFFVIATQNPLEQAGTYPLPESQLDRFLMCLELHYPSRHAEFSLLTGRDRKELLKGLQPLFSTVDIRELQWRIQTVHASAALIAFIQDILEFTRQSKEFQTGLSPRAGLALVRTSKSWAFLQGRDYILPEDVQAVLPWVVCHRLCLTDDFSGLHSKDKIMALLQEVAVP